MEDPGENLDLIFHSFDKVGEVAFLSPSKIISTLKCTVCSSEVATVQDAPRDQHGIHLNFGPLFARHFIERTCSLRAKNEKLKYDCY